MKKNRTKKNYFGNLIKYSGVFLLLAFVLSSCASTITEYRYKHDKFKNDSLYNVEFKIPIEHPCISESPASSLTTNFKPVVFLLCDQWWMSFYAAACPEKDIVRVLATNVVRITTMANGQDPPEIVQPDSGYADCESCKRDRSGYLWEVRAMGGLRRWPWEWNKIDDKSYTNYVDTIYKQEDFGNGIGGSKVLFGVEVSLVRGFGLLDNWFKWLDGTPSSMKIGLMTGVWPMDGSIFIPAAVRLRYTTNIVSKHDCCNQGFCSSLFFFLDGGTPISMNKDTKRFGYFGDIGIGIDLNLGRNYDFSIDCGYRYIYTPLPQLNAPPECRENLDLYPTRKSGDLILRFGFSF